VVCLYFLHFAGFLQSPAKVLEFILGKTVGTLVIDFFNKTSLLLTSSCSHVFLNCFVKILRLTKCPHLLT